MEVGETEFPLGVRCLPGADSGGSGPRRGRALTSEADLDEVQRVQRQVGQDPAAHASHQVLVPDVAEHRAPRRRPGRRLALTCHGLGARRHYGA